MNPKTPLPVEAWRQMIDCLPEAAALCDASLRLLHGNPALHSELGLSLIDLQQRSLPQLVARPGSAMASAEDFPVGQCQHYEMLAGARRRRLQASLIALPGLAGFLWLVHGSTSMDAPAGNGLEASEQGFALALKGAADGIWEWHPVTKALFLSPRLLSIFGYPEDFQVRTTDDWLQLVHPDDRARYNTANIRHLCGKTPHFECEYRIRRADGTWAWGLSRGIAAIDDDGIARRMAGSITDITARKEQEELIHYLATRDSLTTLANRFLLSEMLVDAVARAREAGKHLAVIYLDLDNFKNINDSLGHQVGDNVLVEIARRLRREFPEPELVARQGGDEFIIVVPDAPNPAQVGGRIGRLLDDLRQPIAADAGELVVRASAGIVFFPNEGSDAPTLLKNADLALYAAKARGRGQFAFFDGDMAERAAERLTLERHLATAIAHGELFLEFQPQVDMADGRLTGYEALLRWRHPKLGLVSPVRFIPVAESSGMIIPIGTWVLGEACRQAAAWRAAGHAVPVAVNLSVAQLTHTDFVQTVSEALSVHGLPPQAIELEITESLLMEGGSEALGALDDLAQLGITLSVDDFGTGYSSLAYLKRLPIDKLKIDRSFVSGVHSDRSDAAVVRAIIAIAKELGLAVIAEGIETVEQGNALQHLGCRHAQGYLFGRPMPAEAFRQFLATAGSRA